MMPCVDRGNPSSSSKCTIAARALALAASAMAASSSGAVGINGIKHALNGSATAQAAPRALITRGSANLFADGHARITRRSIDAETQVPAALAALPPLSTTFANNSLASPLKMVARMIAVRGSFGVSRQVFMVSQGGHDLHDNLLDGCRASATSLCATLDSYRPKTAR